MLRRVLAALVSLASLSVPLVASAQDENVTSAARALGQEGVLAAQAGHCEEAVDKLTRAKSLMAAPSILVPLGECQITLGKIVAGTENLQAAARDKLADNAPRAYFAAQERARALLPDALKKLGKLTIEVDAPPRTVLTLLDNGESVNPVLVGAERPADPGKHVVEVSAPGFKKATAEVKVQSGLRASVKIALELDPTQTAPAKETPPAGGPPGPGPVAPPTTSGSTGSNLVTAGAITLGVGGAGLVLGAVFGGLAVGKKASLDDVCDDHAACPSSASDDIHDLKTFGNVSTASLVVGGVAAAAGATLLVVGLTRGHDGDKAALVPLLGPGYLGLKGRF